MPAVWIAAEMLVTKEKQGTFGCPAFENQRKTKRTSVGCPFCGARGGSRTRTPLRALAPEASEEDRKKGNCTGQQGERVQGGYPKVCTGEGKEDQTEEDDPVDHQATQVRVIHNYSP